MVKRRASRLGPDLGQGLAEAAPAGLARGSGRGAAPRSPDRGQRQQHAMPQTAPSPRAGGRRERSRKRPASAAVTTKPKIIISQTRSRPRAPPVRRDPLGQQREQRRAGGADADADQRRRRGPRARCRREVLAIKAVAPAAPTPPSASTRHAADDPGRAPSADDPSRGPARAQTCTRSAAPPAGPGGCRQASSTTMTRLMRGGGQHDDGAERGLHQAEPEIASQPRALMSRDAAPGRAQGEGG